MIDTPTPSVIFNKFTIYNYSFELVIFKKMVRTAKNDRTTHTHLLSLVLSHTLLYGILFIIAFSKFTLLQAGCYFFLRVHYNYYYDTPKLFNYTPLIFHNQVYLIDYYHLAKQLVVYIHEDHVDGLLEYPQV